MDYRIASVGDHSLHVMESFLRFEYLHQLSKHLDYSRDRADRFAGFDLRLEENLPLFTRFNEEFEVYVYWRHCYHPCGSP